MNRPVQIFAMFTLGMMMFAGRCSAQTPTLLYSFENGDSPDNLDGFAANASAVPITQSTIGATNGSYSMDFSQAASDTFTGAITQDLPAALSSPWTEEINFDLTIPATDQFTGTFARIGISEFGINPSQGFTTPYPVQCTAQAEQNIDLAPGTYNMSIPMQARFNPVTGAGPVTFFSCFGSDPDTQLTLTDFEFFINKSNDQPLTVYIDNVKAQPLLGDTNDDFSVDATDLATVNANLGKTVTGGYADGDFNGDGVVNEDDLALYQLGVVEYNFLNFQTLPEPSGVGLLAAALSAAAIRRHRRIVPC